MTGNKKPGAEPGFGELVKLPNRLLPTANPDQKSYRHHGEEGSMT